MLIGNITVTGSGTGRFTVGKAGLYTGSTTINSGTLENNANGVLPISTVLTLTGGTYDLNGFTQTVAGIAGTGGTITNIGGAKLLTIANATNGSSNTYDGDITGTIQITLNLTGTGSPIQWFTSANSSFSGAVTITSGTLGVSHLANSSANSSIGTGSVTPAISIASAGILKYLGTGGHSTNRAITLTGSGATLNASGSGSTVTFGGNITGNNFGLNLTGTGLGTVSSVIGTTGGTVTKSDTGTWSLIGSNTYTGITTIKNGTLSINTLKSVSAGASSLGAPTTAPNGTITLGDITDNTTGTLSYTGTGDTSNRAFTLAGVTTTGGGR